MHIFAEEFVNEIICLEKIGQHNLKCNPESIINSPDLYFYGYIETKEFCGFYMCMEDLEFVDEKPTLVKEINQGTRELKKIYSLGIIHNDVKLSNVCFDKLNKKFYIFDFGLSLFFPTKDDIAALKTLKMFRYLSGDRRKELLALDIQNMECLLD